MKEVQTGAATERYKHQQYRLVTAVGKEYAPDNRCDTSAQVDAKSYLK